MSSWKPWTLFVLTVAGSGYALYWMKGRLDQFRARNAELEQSLSAKAKVLTKVKTERVTMESRIDELEIRDRELSDAVAEKDKELARLKATYNEMESKLTQEIKNGEIRLTQIGEKLSVELVDKILFDSGDAKISKRGEEVLMRVGQVLGQIRDKQIQVSGHTDNLPISEKLTAQFPTNWELSVARATNVVRFLGEKGGVPEQLLIISGHGPHKPVATNSTPVGRSRNRRIEILLTPLLEVANPLARSP